MKTVAPAAAPLAVHAARAPSRLVPISVPFVPAQPRRQPHTRKRPQRWEWRAALTFFCMVSLALVLAHRSDKAYVHASGDVSSEPVSASSIASFSSVADSLDLHDGSASTGGEMYSFPLSPSPMQWGWDQAPRNPTVDNAEEAVVRASVVNKMALDNAGHHEKGLIAHDTVTYLDPRYRPYVLKGQSANRSARVDSASRKHNGGVVAANTVTYLNKPIPKPAK
jgi:hypothetical protein